MTLKKTIPGVLALLAATGLLAGCRPDRAAAAPSPAEARDHEHEEDGHGHARPAAPQAGAGGACADEKGGDACGAAEATETAALASCEHQVATYLCAECRYEAGVVRLDPCLLKGGASGGGLVGTQAVARVPVLETLRTTGEVVLNDNTTVHVRPRIPGTIEAVHVDLGARVQAGDPLFTLASPELGKTLAEHRRNRTLVQLAEKVLARETRLRDQKVGSEQDLIEAQVAYEQHRAEWEATGQALRGMGLAEEELAAPAGAAPGLLVVRAPAPGVILDRHAVAGELAEPGEEVLLIADPGTVWAWADVQARDLARLLAAARQGPVAADVTVAAFPDRVFPGTLDYVGATMEEATRTVKARVSLANPEGLLRPGMFCEAAFAIRGEGRTEEALAVPVHALFSDEGRDFVFAHWREDFYRRRAVRRGRDLPGGLVEILDGVKAGETIVAEGGFLFKSDVLREKMGAGCAD